MFIRKKPLYDKKVSVQICEGFREKGKVRQRVLRHVGSADHNNHETLDKLVQAVHFLKGENVQYSVLKHEETQCRYRLPSKMSLEARRIYGVFNLKREGYITQIM